MSHLGRKPHRFHLGLHLIQFPKQGQRARRLASRRCRLIANPDMHQHPFADTGLRRDARRPTMKPMFIGRRTPPTCTIANASSASMSSTIRPGMPRHMASPVHARERCHARAAATAACPNARPPSLAGTSRVSARVRPSAASRSITCSSRYTVLEHAARQRDGSSPVPAGSVCRSGRNHARDRDRETLVEARAQSPAPAFRAMIVQQCLHIGQRFHQGRSRLAPTDRERVEPPRARARAVPAPRTRPPPGPRTARVRGKRPAAAATASNSRPQELANGAFTPRAIMPSSTARGLGGQEPVKREFGIVDREPRPAHLGHRYGRRCCATARGSPARRPAWRPA